MLPLIFHAPSIWYAAVAVAQMKLLENVPVMRGADVDWGLPLTPSDAKLRRQTASNPSIFRSLEKYNQTGFILLSAILILGCLNETSALTYFFNLIYLQLFIFEHSFFF